LSQKASNNSMGTTYLREPSEAVLNPLNEESART
jgi:hypothetical protein